MTCWGAKFFLQNPKGGTLKVLNLIQGLPVKQIFYNSLSDDYEVKSVTGDARKAQLGDLFVAIRGQKYDGHSALGELVEKGLDIFVVEDTSKVPSHFRGIVIWVENTRSALDTLASNYFHSPSNELFTLGVTGTNGKTSTTYMIEWILNKLHLPCGVMGTINHHLQEKVWSTEMTTPGPMELQGRLREMVSLGAKAVAMEVSSHALIQSRVNEVNFNTVVFTNLTRDHLDYHGTMNDYFLAKQKLFTDLLWKTKKPSPFAIINTDDYFGKRTRVASTASVWTYGKNKKADFRYKIETMSYVQMQIYVQSLFGDFRFSLPICGAYNAANALAAIASVATTGVPPVIAAEALTDFAGVPGRLQRVRSDGAKPFVFVDYAHTPDALENVLSTLSEIKNQQKIKSKIICVFGCGGDRDPGKRSLMAQVAEKLSDIVVVTSDNPRSESPERIIEDIEAGFTKNYKYHKEIDRRMGISKALKLATAQDVVLIAGKGHEDYQIIGSEKIHFSDIETAKELMDGI